MMLQQNSGVLIWGWGKPNEEIRIMVSWDPEKEYAITVPNQSTWNLTIVTIRIALMN